MNALDLSQESRYSFRWQPITDLPDNWNSLRNPELDSLAQVWSEQAGHLKEEKGVKTFNERLRREWSIETGIIERLYTIDRGTTQLLIEQGIDAALIPHGATDRPVAEVIRIIQDHRNALEGLFDFVSGRLPLTTSYIRQLHQVITRSQTHVDGIDQFGNLVQFILQKGQWKQWPNNPKRPDGLIHEYCPPLQVAGEMERLVAYYNSHVDVMPEIEAAWLHHRFTQIHPFQDGNGRVARALSTIVFLRAGWFPLAINSLQRSDYISALEEADHGNLVPLVNMFGQNAKHSFARALEISDDILKGEVVLPQVIDTIAAVYQQRKTDIEKTFSKVEETAEQFCVEVERTLKETSSAIHRRFATISAPPFVKVARNNPQSEHYYSAQIVEVAKSLKYWANVMRKRLWVRLLLVDRINKRRTYIVFSFHYLGKVNRGVMVCSSFIYFPNDGSQVLPSEESMEAEPQLGETHRICSEPFYFSYRDSAEERYLKSQFQQWVNESISIGLTEWAQHL